MTDDRAWSPAERAALATTAICVGMLLVTSLAFAIDDRLLRGVSIWSKPVKFAASFGLHMATLLVFALLLSEKARDGRLAVIALGSASVTTLIEVLYVALQSARGRSSHFNTETAWESFMYYQVMGAAALILVAATALVGVLILRDARPDIGAGLRLGAGWGAIVSAAATLAVAGVLASGALSGAGPWIGEPRTDAGGLPMVGWSTEAGDLRVPHFVATHSIQAMALAGWLADRAFGHRRRPTRLAVAAVAGLCLITTFATFVQAVQGVPLLRVGVTELLHEGAQVTRLTGRAHGPIQADVSIDDANLF